MRRVELVDHRLGDQADAVLGAPEALGVELGSSPTTRPSGILHAAVDDDVASAARARPIST